MSTSLFLGIDPGFKGGLALIAREPGVLEASLPMPTHHQEGRAGIDTKALIDWLRPYSARIALAAIEDVSAMPGQGVTGMFRFGYGTGLVTGILAALEIRTIKIKPAVWKSALGLSRDKDASLRKAALIFSASPNFEFFGKKQDGQAEAALIAHFALTKLESLAQYSIYD